MSGSSWTDIEYSPLQMSDDIHLERKKGARYRHKRGATAYRAWDPHLFTPRTISGRWLGWAGAVGCDSGANPNSFLPPSLSDCSVVSLPGARLPPGLRPGGRFVACAPRNPQILTPRSLFGRWLGWPGAFRLRDTVRDPSRAIFCRWRPTPSSSSSSSASSLACSNQAPATTALLPPTSRRLLQHISAPTMRFVFLLLLAFSSATKKLDLRTAFRSLDLVAAIHNINEAILLGAPLMRTPHRRSLCWGGIKRRF